MTRRIVVVRWRLIVSALGLLTALSATAATQAPVEFEVASIKRNTSAIRTATPPSSPYRGQFVMSWTTVRAMVSMAYHDPLPWQIVGLPGWAESERYDVIAKAKSNVTEQEQTQMWRALLADRLTLRAHYERRPQPAYKLVMARPDRRLGPKVTQSACRPPDPGPEFILMNNAADVARMAVSREQRRATPQEEAAMLAMCRPVVAGNTLYAGGATVKELLSSIQLLGRLDRPLVDGTNLQGRYSVTLTAAPPPIGPSSLDDPPTLLSALPDQLGLTLEPTSKDGTVLVIDHIERPSEN